MEQHTSSRKKLQSDPKITFQVETWNVDSSENSASPVLSFKNPFKAFIEECPECNN